MPEVRVQPRPGGVEFTVGNTHLSAPSDQLRVYDGLVSIVRIDSVGPRTVVAAVDTNWPVEAGVGWRAGVPGRVELNISRAPVIRLLDGSRVGIDPGHGGHDRGCAGARYHEADIALAIARLVGRWLTGHGATAVFTRLQDVDVPREKRLRLLRRERLDLCLSLHTGCDQGARRGTGVRYGPNSASRHLAACLHEALMARSPHLVDAGVAPSEDPLLQRLRRPAVTVLPETITNHLGEGLLRDSDFQKSVAQSLFHGLVGFLAGIEHPVP